MHTVMGLANIQEQSTNQQEHIQQRNIDNQQTIHYTIRNATKRLRTTYVFTPETNLIPLALEMLVSKKKDNSLNVLLVSLNYRGVHAHITPKMLDVLCTGNLTPRKHFETEVFSVFSCAESFEVTRLEEIDISVFLQLNQDDCDLQPLSGKKK